MRALITQKIADLTTGILSTLDNYSFFTSKECRFKAFEDVDYLERWYGTMAPDNVIEEDLLDICKTPDEMQEYFELMLHQIPKQSILDEYLDEEKLELYEVDYGRKLRVEAEGLIAKLCYQLVFLLIQLSNVGYKYRLVNPYDKDLSFLQEQPQKAPEGAIILPDVLNTEGAKKVFQKAIQAGFMSKEGTRYKWHKSKALLAYFLGHWLKDGQFPERKYNILFGESRLGKTYSQLMNNKLGGGKPRGYEMIDELFKEQPK